MLAIGTLVVEVPWWSVHQYLHLTVGMITRPLKAIVRGNSINTVGVLGKVMWKFITIPTTTGLVHYVGVASYDFRRGTGENAIDRLAFWLSIRTLHAQVRCHF
jgi:hypothetical protein